jgi:lipoyl(octanoyl) transferase
MISSLEIKVEDHVIEYPKALDLMEARARHVFDGSQSPLLWLLEHPPLYTLGTSASSADILNHELPAYETGRGGQVTYHGPGQRVAYVVINLKDHSQDLRAYVRDLEEWLILTLKDLGIEGLRREGRVGIWIIDNGVEKKIAAIGVRVKKWVTLHGIALNVYPNLSHYEGIVPCGLPQYGITSLHDLGVETSMAEVDKSLIHNFHKVFG